ncbi:hypothetical protein C8Q80DRAFT_1188462 [Daedaleopsis nitida]|nr:hypothetical protein C8Q80DRAFT_1188462 [Daedaleopsis nitida]
MSSLTDSRPSKRPRTSSTSELEDAEHSTTRTRDGEFWYEDGSIILVARDVEFRIYYKGLLAIHSSIFLSCT